MVDETVLLNAYGRSWTEERPRVCACVSLCVVSTTCSVLASRHLPCTCVSNVASCLAEPRRAVSRECVFSLALIVLINVVPKERKKPLLVE